MKIDYIDFSLDEQNGEIFLSINVPQEVADKKITPTTTERLGQPRVVEQNYENPDGTPIDFTLDMLGNKRGEDIVAGPFARLSAGENKFVVWKK